MNQQVQIPRADVAGLLTWLQMTLVDLDALSPSLKSHTSLGTGKVQEEVCAWDEVAVGETRSFPLKDEQGEPVLDGAGKQEWLRYVKLSKRSLSYTEQAMKLLGVFPIKLAPWKEHQGTRVVARLLEYLRQEAPQEQAQEQAKARAKERAEVDKATNLSGNWEVERLVASILD